MQRIRGMFFATAATVCLPMAAGEVEPQPPINTQQVGVVTEAFHAIKNYWLTQGVSLDDVELVFLEENTSACGVDSGEALGIYCDDSKEVFLTTENFDQLASKRAGFTTAATFVVAHELGHAVQHALHVENREHSLDELLATCLAGTAMAAVYPERIPYEELKPDDDSEDRFYTLAIHGADCIDIFETGLGG